jgi:hypothetical protein
MPTRQGFAGREEVLVISRCPLSDSTEAKIGGPPPIEGIDDGPLPGTYFTRA